MTQFTDHKYEYTVQFGTPTHSWSLIGPEGGVHYHARTYNEERTICGLECHASGRATMHSRGRAPSHLECWLIKEPCWHEGSATFATEQWPIVEGYLKSGNHEAVWKMLEVQYCKYFMDHSDEEEGQ